MDLSFCFKTPAPFYISNSCDPGDGQHMSASFFLVRTAGLSDKYLSLQSLQWLDAMHLTSDGPCFYSVGLWNLLVYR